MNKHERDELIISVMDGIPVKVDRYLRSNRDCRHLRDDLIGEANAAAVSEADKIMAGTVAANNPKDYLYRAAYNAITRAAQNAAVAGTTKSMRQNCRRKGVVPPEISVSSIELSEADFDSRGQESDSSVSTRDLINHCCQTEQESAIVELRSRGHVDAEIAERLNISPSSVYRSRKRVEARFDAECQSLGA